MRVYEEDTMVQATCETYCSARPACSHYIFRTHSWMGADNQQIRRSSSRSSKTKEGYCWLYQTNATHANGNEGVEGVERNKAAMVVVVNASDTGTVLCTRQDDHHTHDHNHVSVMASMLSEFADDLAIIFSGSIFASSKKAAGGAGAGAAHDVEGGEACQL